MNANAKSAAEMAKKVSGEPCGAHLVGVCLGTAHPTRPLAVGFSARDAEESKLRPYAGRIVCSRCASLLHAAGLSLVPGHRCRTCGKWGASSLCDAHWAEQKRQDKARAKAEAHQACSLGAAWDAACAAKAAVEHYGDPEPAPAPAPTPTAVVLSPAVIRAAGNGTGLKETPEFLKELRDLKAWTPPARAKKASKAKAAGKKEGSSKRRDGRGGH